MNTTTKRNGFSLDDDMAPIMEGKIALPNIKPIESDVGAKILHFREMHCGTALVSPGNKHWNARFFLDCGQAGQLYGSGVAAWTEWRDGAYRATAMRFAICEHKTRSDAGADHRRGWHPAHCELCGLDLTIDSGD